MENNQKTAVTIFLREGSQRSDIKEIIYIDDQGPNLISSLAFKLLYQVGTAHSAYCPCTSVNPTLDVMK